MLGPFLILPPILHERWSVATFYSQGTQVVWAQSTCPELSAQGLVPLPFPSPGDLPDPGIEPRFPTLQADSLPADPEEGNGNPFQYSCLGNLMDRGAWWATVYGVTKGSDTTEQLNNNDLSIDV